VYFDKLLKKNLYAAVADCFFSRYSMNKNNMQESILFRGSVSARNIGKGGRGRGAQNRRASSNISDDSGYEIYDQSG
jgi:hypothetical protein